MYKSYANVLNVPNSHSMVLAKPGETSYFHIKIPAFDIKYIEDCFKIKDFPDVTKYLIKSKSPANYTKNDIYDCWLYQNKSWSDLVSIPENKNNNLTIISSSTNLISQTNRYVLKHIDIPTYKIDSVISTMQSGISKVLGKRGSNFLITSFGGWLV
ncbi:Myb DNA-bind 2 domain-containing protein [Aphis craccivora]|uniref:Myb DNA-bind 2 domain-containing protein n=1 Tax=Aphis craccivora TaxID=307492 RepID=A0A6G0VUF4_APHCR|nr:Myb DNA-bind 2 domain-containing protein [Aphis craccivora]